MKNENQFQNNTCQEDQISCGNCWGYQEWDGKISEAQLKSPLNRVNGFILAFLKKYVPK